MTDDESAIREVIDTWLAASRSGNLQTLLGLMTDDVVFMVPGQAPFGKEKFASNFKSMKDIRIDGKIRIEELQVLGDWAWLRNHLEITMTPPDGNAPVRRAGYTLTILRKASDGRWRLARDANLLT
jgi:uncharacterized protein (TIGR02246 family)